MRSKRHTVPDDIHEAVQAREDAKRQLRKVRAQAPFVARLVGGLVERRDENHFIELLNMHARRQQ